MKFEEKIVIKKQPDTCITDDIDEFTLGNYNIFAGNNNAGKTHLLNAISSEVAAAGFHVVHIPAERVIAKNEVDTSTQSDPMTKAITELTEVIFDHDKAIKTKIKDIETSLPATFDNYGVEKTSLKVTLGKASADEYKKSIKAIYAKKLIDAITIQDDWAGIDGIELSKVGQGTQRIIVASLIHYLAGKREKGGNTKSCLIFEEPEVYLHPLLKKKLYDDLIKLSKNTLVVVSTHDPYFIQLNKGQNIFEVCRRDPDGATQVKPISKEYLQYDSYAEINYLVFGVSSEAYFLELYDQVKRDEGYKHYHEFDKYMFDSYFNAKGDQQNCQDDSNPANNIMPITRLRHNIAHGKNENQPINLDTATKKLIDFKEKNPG